MCGELNPSFVCSKHAGTYEDWRYEPPKTKEEEEADNRNSQNNLPGTEGGM